MQYIRLKAEVFEITGMKSLEKEKGAEICFT